MLTLALSSWSFHRQLPYFGERSSSPQSPGEELSILDFPALTASYGIDQIEICQTHLASTDPAYLQRVRDAVDAAGCRVINVPVDVAKLAVADPAERDRELQRILSWIDAARVVGSPAVRVNTGEAGQMDEEEAIQVVAEGYRRLAAYAAERDMLILLENHGGLSKNPSAIVDLLAAVGVPNFRLCPDFGNFPPETRDRGLRLMLPHAAVVHAKVRDIDPEGRQAALLEHCIALVRESEYSGPLSIEFEGKGDEYEGVRQGRDLLLSLLRPRTARARPPRVAIMGTGMIANRHVGRWRDAGAEVVTAVDIDPVVLADFARRHGISATSTDYQVLLQGSEASRFEIVDICTPPWLHAPMAIAAAQAGKHVLVEKPLALSSLEAEAMAEAAERAGTVLACRQGNTRLTAEARTVRDIVRSGVLGDLYFLRLIGRSLYRPGIEYNPGAAWFLDRSKAGGGSLFDWGVYDLDLLFAIFGPLDVVETTALTFRGIDDSHLETPFDVEEHAAAMLKLRNGPTIYWERAWATHLPKEQRWDFYGSRAGLSFVAHSDVLRLDMDLKITRYGPGAAVELEVPPMAPPGPNVYEDFLLAVDGEREPAVTAREAAAMLRIIEAIYAAAERGA